jgi:hypothetical protein
MENVRTCEVGDNSVKSVLLFQRKKALEERFLGYWENSA